MLSKEQKRQIFIQLRKDNFHASSRLEGLPAVVNSPHPVAPTLAQLKAKYVR